MNTKKSFKITLVVLGIIVLGFLGIYYFVYRDIKTKNEHISSLTQQLDFQSGRQEYLLSTQRMIQNLNSDMEKINNSIIGTDGDVTFIEDLENRAKNNGLEIEIESLAVEEDKAFSASGVTTLKLKAKTKGNWSGTYTFLSTLESLPFKIKVNNFALKNDTSSLSPEGVQVYSPIWQSSFEITALKYK
jgi:hypothetical protein